MKHDSAVSPVIGVLLMLTLTLIIAAIVNSFAAGLMDTREKPPSFNLQGEFHRGNGENWNLTLHHLSGDPIPTCCVDLILHPSKTFGCGYETIKEIENKHIRTNATSDRNWMNGISSMKAGDVHGIFDTKKNITVIQPEGIDLLAEQSIGNTFYLEFYYDRVLVAKSEILIEP